MGHQWDTYYPKNQLGPSEKEGFDSVFLRVLGSPNHHFWDPMILRIQTKPTFRIFRWNVVLDWFFCSRHVTLRLVPIFRSCQSTWPPQTLMSCWMRIWEKSVEDLSINICHLMFISCFRLFASIPNNSKTASGLAVLHFGCITDVVWLITYKMGPYHLEVPTTPHRGYYFPSYPFIRPKNRGFNFIYNYVVGAHLVSVLRFAIFFCPGSSTGFQDRAESGALFRQRGHTCQWQEVGGVSSRGVQTPNVHANVPKSLQANLLQQTVW